MRFVLDESNEGNLTMNSAAGLKGKDEREEQLRMTKYTKQVTATKSVIETVPAVIGELSEPHALGCIVRGVDWRQLQFSFFESDEEKLTDAQVNRCIGMPGGGKLNLNPGQLTGIGELILC